MLGGLRRSRGERAGVGVGGGAAFTEWVSDNVQRFRGGLAFKVHRLMHHSTLVLRVIKKKNIRLHAKRGRYRDRYMTV